MSSSNTHKSEAIPSKAAIKGHPIHPILIPFPIAFLCAAPVTDLVFLFSKSPFWAQASFWLILAGILTGLAAALFGFWDFSSITKVRQHPSAWIHFLGNSLVLILSIINFYIRIDSIETLSIFGFILSLLVAVILVVTGWYGGELSYRHRIGVMEHPHG